MTAAQKQGQAPAPLTPDIVKTKLELETSNVIAGRHSTTLSTTSQYHSAENHAIHISLLCVNLQTRARTADMTDIDLVLHKARSLLCADAIKAYVTETHVETQQLVQQQHAEIER